MPTIDRPLDSNERAAITRQIMPALKLIGADRAVAPPPEKLQQLIGMAIDSYRKLGTPLPVSTLESMSQSLGSLWGQTVCDQWGWTWAAVKLEEADPVFAVVTPNRSHAVFPMAAIRNLLAHPDTGGSSFELYLSLQKEALPPAEAKSYFVLGM